MPNSELSNKDIGRKVLYKRKDKDAYVKGYLVDYLPSTKMVSFGDSKYSEAVYYFNQKLFDIQFI